MTIAGHRSGERRRPTAGEVVPLRERIAYMESLRAAIGAVVLAAVAVGAADRGRPELVVSVTAAYLTARSCRSPGDARTPSGCCPSRTGC